jgi:hypothetical protein
MLLAAVLVVGFIGMSSPSSIFAQYYYNYEKKYSQYYDGDYEKSYEKYMKNDDSGRTIKNIKCNNIIKNSPNDNNNLDAPNALGLSNENSQSDQDRMNANHKGNFVYICQNNNNNNNIENNVNNVNNGNTASFSFVNNNTLQQNQNGNFTITMECGNGNALTQGNFTDSNGNNFTNLAIGGDNVQCTISQTQTGNITDNTQNNPPGTTSPSSISNVEQPSVQTQQISSLHNNNGINIQQQRIEDSSDLTAMEKVTKLKTQWLSQLP